MASVKILDRRAAAVTPVKDKLFGGRETAQDVFVKALKRPCSACKRPAVMVVNTHAPQTGFSAEQLAVLIAMWGGNLPQTIPTVHGDYINISRVYACKACSRELKRAAAKSPSHWMVDIDDGPGSDKLVIRPHAS